MSAATIPQAERQRIYEALAREFMGGEYVKVTFVRGLRSFAGLPCDGLARWSGLQHAGKFYYEILLDADLDPDREATAAAHELAHVKARDPAQIAPRYLSRIVRHAAAQGQRTITEQGDPQEDRAAILGAILKLHWRVHDRIKW